MKQADLLIDIEKNGAPLLQIAMPEWEDTWYVIPRSKGPRYVGVVDRCPPLPNPNRLSPNRWPTPLLGSIAELIWLLHDGMDTTELTYVNPIYAIALGDASVTYINDYSKKYPLRNTNWTRSWRRSYLCGIMVPYALELVPSELVNPKLIADKLRTMHATRAQFGTA